ncbi:hypothetical protein Hanom_Chr04g00348721 [Helianthus anomalus]
MMSKINETSSKQEFIGKVVKHENKENREIRPEQSSFLRSKLPPNDSRNLKHSEILEICSIIDLGFLNS